MPAPRALAMGHYHHACPRVNARASPPKTKTLWLSIAHGSRDVANWFASLRATPVAADRSMPVLSVIMREAEAMGFRPEGSNPCKGIRRYRRKGRERFLSDDESLRP